MNQNGNKTIKGLDVSNYLEIKVPIRWDAEWFAALRDAFASEGIPVRWQTRFFHITVAFINNDEPVEALKVAFDRLLADRNALSLTLDKLDAFVANDAPVIIVDLTASHPSPEFNILVHQLRETALENGAVIYGNFLLHVTLGRIDSANASLQQVQEIVSGIQVPPFTLQLDEAEYRYYRGESIRSWKLKS